MLVFSTRIPLNNVVSMQDCLDVFAEWVTGSPHYHIENIDYCVNTDADFDYSNEYASVSIRQYHSDDIKLLACRLGNADDVAVYSTDCIFLNENGDRSLLIQLNRSQTNYNGKLRRVKKPYILRHVINYDFYKDDAGIPVVDTPLCTEDYLDICKDIISGTHSNTMPVVYISKDHWDGTVVDINYLAQQLGGIAHVFVEKDRSTSMYLREQTNGSNVHSGYVGIYSPKTRYCRKFSIKDYQDKKQMAWDIINSVWAVQINRLDSSTYNWNQVIALLSRQRMLEWQDISDIAKSDLDALMKSHTKEIADLKEQRDALNKQLYDAEAERDTYRARLSDNSNAGKCFYNAGTEKPLYDSEQNDLLYSILSQVKGKFLPNSRGYALICSMLEANPRVGDCEAILADVDRAMSSGGKLNSSAKSLLKKHGFTIAEDTKHYKLTFHDPRYMFTAAKTPSEHRGGDNLASQIRRVLDVEKKI